MKSILEAPKLSMSNMMKNPAKELATYHQKKVFCKKCVIKNFTKFTGKHLCQSIFFNKVAGLTPSTFLKKRIWHRCFPVNFEKFLRNCIFIKHLRWLLPYYKNIRFSQKVNQAPVHDLLSFVIHQLRKTYRLITHGDHHIHFHPIQKSPPILEILILQPI